MHFPHKPVNMPGLKWIIRHHLKIVFYLFHRSYKGHAVTISQLKEVITHNPTFETTLTVQEFYLVAKLCAFKVRKCIYACMNVCVCVCVCVCVRACVCVCACDIVQTFKSYDISSFNLQWQQLLLGIRRVTVDHMHNLRCYASDILKKKTLQVII